MKKTLFLIISMSLFFGCVKGEKELNLIESKVHSAPQGMAEIDSQNASEEIENNGEFIEVDSVATNNAPPFVEVLLRNAIYYTHFVEILPNDICQNIKETYRKISIIENSITITDVSEYHSYPKDPSTLDEECQTNKFDKVTYVKTGFFSVEELNKDLNLLIQDTVINLKKFNFDQVNYYDTRSQDESTFLINVEVKNTAQGYQGNINLLAYDNNLFFNVSKVVSINNNHIETSSNLYWSGGRNSLQEQRFMELAHLNGTQTEDFKKYLSIFTKNFK